MFEVWGVGSGGPIWGPRNSQKRSWRVQAHFLPVLLKEMIRKLCEIRGPDLEDSGGLALGVLLNLGI